MADAESLTSEFEDSGRAGRTWRSLDYSRLLEPNGLRRIVGIIIALMVVFWPARSEVILGRLLGIGLIGYGILTLWSLRRSRPVLWGTALWSLAAVIVGGLLAAFPAETEVALERMPGSKLVGRPYAPLMPYFESYREREDGTRKGFDPERRGIRLLLLQTACDLVYV